MMSGISICIVNFNGANLIEKFLPQVIECMCYEKDFNWELLFFDNGSSDDSVNIVRKIYPEARILTSPENLGFAKSNNIAVKFANYEYILFLNNDVVPQKGFLKPLMETIESEKVFAVAPRMLRFNNQLDDGVRNAEFKTGLLTPVLDEKKSMADKAIYTTFFCGGAVLVKKDIFNELGGFDLIFNPYAWEDLDIAYRAWKRGYEIIYQPASVVFHLRETTAKKVYSKLYMKTIVWRNRFLFIWKNLGLFPWVAAHIIYLPSKLVKFIFTGRGAYVIGFFWALNYIPQVISRRIQERKKIKRSDLEIFNLMRLE